MIEKSSLPKWAVLLKKLLEEIEAKRQKKSTAARKKEVVRK